MAISSERVASVSRRSAHTRRWGTSGPAIPPTGDGDDWALSAHQPLATSTSLIDSASIINWTWHRPLLVSPGLRDLGSEIKQQALTNIFPFLVLAQAAMAAVAAGASTLALALAPAAQAAQEVAMLAEVRLAERPCGIKMELKSFAPIYCRSLGWLGQF